MQHSDKIYVAGHTGLVGSALVRRLTSYNVIMVPHVDLDLLDYASTANFFDQERPDYVILAAARVGGILDNDTHPVEFLDQNSRIQLNVLRAAAQVNPKKLLFLGSSCIYPRNSPQPIPESALLSGPLEPTNDAYAIAKLSGIVACRSYNRQAGTNFIAAMPANLYGPNDNFDLTNSHVLPALIRKIHLAKVRKYPTVTLWGSGNALREFLYVDDLADACVHILDKFVPKSHALEDVIVNVGSGQDIRISALSSIIADIIGYGGMIQWDTEKPDGTPRKVLDTSRINNLGWTPRTELLDGITETYKWFLENEIQ